MKIRKKELLMSLLWTQLNMGFRILYDFNDVWTKDEDPFKGFWSGPTLNIIFGLPIMKSRKIAIRICFKYFGRSVSVSSILKEGDQYLFQRRKLSMSSQMKEVLNITDPQPLEGIRGDVNDKTWKLETKNRHCILRIGRECPVFFLEKNLHLLLFCCPRPLADPCVRVPLAMPWLCHPIWVIVHFSS